jgi:hypothetical protein
MEHCRNFNNSLSLGYTTANGVKSYQRDFQKGKNSSVKETSVIPNTDVVMFLLYVENLHEMIR